MLALSAERTSPGSAFRHLVITVHGIRTYGKWQDRLEMILKQESGGRIEVRNYRYNYFSVIEFMVPFVREIVTRQFRRSLLAACSEQSWDRIDLVGHSFGTHLIAWALHSLPPKQRPRIHTVILAGSVLKPTFRWGDLIPEYIRRLINECGTRDGILILNQVAVLLTGMAGRVGFTGMQGDHFRNRYFNCGHSGYFQRADLTPQDDFMRDRWLPLLTGDDPPELVDQRKSLTALGGLREYVLKNLEPFKIACCMALVGLFVWWIIAQRFAAIHQLAETRWLVAQGARGGRYSPNEVSCIKATHYLLKAAEASRLTFNRAGKDNALLAAKGEAASVLLTLLHDKPIIGAKNSPDGKWILTWGLDDNARIWDATNGAEVGQPINHKALHKALFSPDSELILTWGRGGVMQLWHATNGRVAGQPIKIVHEPDVRDSLFSEDGRHILTWSWKGGTVRLWRAADGLPVGNEMRHTTGVYVYGATFSADGKHILSWGGDPDNFGGELCLWNANDGRPVGNPLYHRERISGATLSPDGNTILGWTGSWLAGKGEAQLWQVADGKLVGGAMKHERAVNGALFSKDGQCILTWSGDYVTHIGEVRLWRADDSQEVGTAMNHEDWVEGATLSSDSQRILSWSRDGTARLWQTFPYQPIGKPMENQGGVVGIAFSADGKRILTWVQESGENGGMARLWRAADGEPVGKPMSHEEWLQGAAFSPDNKWILTWSGNSEVGKGGIKLWQATDGQPVGIPVTLGESVDGAQFSSDGQRILTWWIMPGMVGEGKIRLWQGLSEQSVKISVRAEVLAKGAVFSPDGRCFLTWGSDPESGTNCVRLWNSVDGQPVGQPMKHKAVIGMAKFSPDGGRILCWSDDGIGRLLRTTGFKPVGLEMKHDTIFGATFGPDGRRIVSWGGRGKESNEGEMRLWDGKNGHQICPPIQHRNFVKGVVFSPDGQRILTLIGSSNEKNEIRLWQAVDGCPIGSAMVHDDEVFGAVFSPKGHRILSWSRDGTARLWNSANSQCIAIFPHNYPVTAAAFSPDEAHILTASGRTALLWDISVDNRRIPLRDRILEFEVRSATKLDIDGRVHVLSSNEWEERRQKLLKTEIQFRRALTPSGNVRALTEEEVAAKQNQLDKLRSIRNQGPGGTGKR